MRSPLTVLALLVALAFAAVGCGSDSSSSSTEATAASPTAGSTGGNSNQKASAETGKKGEKGSESSQGSSGSNGSKHEKIDTSEFKPVPGGDNSIQEFGDEASGGEEDEIAEAMFAFFRAMARSDYAAVCDGLTKANREALEQFLKLKHKEGTCETVLEEILVSAASEEAKKAAEGTLYEVRVEGENAFVLFTPAGGKASYFVMKNENGEWKATSISAGTPFNPTG